MRESNEPIGRSGEMAALKAVLDETAAGQKRGVVLSGTPGMGKTTLLLWAKEYAQGGGFACAASRSVASGGLPPRHLLSELLGGLDATWAPSDQVPNVTDKSVHVQVDQSPALEVGRPPDLLQVARTLNQVAERAHVALFIDDIQWVPDEDISLLLSALQMVSGSVALLLTERSGTPDHKFHSALATLMAELPISRLDVEGLDVDAVSQLASARLGGPILPSLSLALQARTLGNPLFVIETVRHWQSTGQVARVAGGHWGFLEPGTKPDADSLLEMISARLKRLDPAAADLATGLAILERAATIDFVARLANPEKKLQDLLSHLEDAGILERKEPSTYRLSHPLYQAALVAELGPTRRAAWHEAIFESLTQGLVPATATELAFHASRALRPPNDLESLLLAAALEAEESGSAAEASRWYEMLASAASTEQILTSALAGRAKAVVRFDPPLAIRLFSSALELGQPSDQEARLLMGRARAHLARGHFEEGLSDLERAREVAAGEQLLELRGQATLIRATAGELEEAEIEWRQLLTETAGTAIHGRILGNYALIPYTKAKLADAAAVAEQGFAVSTNQFDRRNNAVNLIWFLILLGRWAEAEKMTTDLFKEVEGANDLWTLIPVLTSAAYLYIWKGESSKALDLATQAVVITDHYLSDQVERLSALIAYGAALEEVGDIPAALEALLPAQELASRVPERMEVQPLFTLLAHVYLRLGDIESALKASAKGKAYLKFNLTWEPGADCADAHIALARGRPNDALVTVGPWLTNPSEIPYEQGRLHEVAAYAYQRLGQRVEALSQAQAAKEVFRKLGARGRLSEVTAWIEKTLSPRGRRKSQLPGHLTERELEIIRLVARGKTNREIAEELTITSGTVKKHIENIKDKAGVHRRTELVSFSMSLGSDSEQ